MAEFSENRHISNLINMSCKVCTDYSLRRKRLYLVKLEKRAFDKSTEEQQN